MKRVDVCNGCEKKLRSLLQTPSLHTRSLAGGSPAASYFSCFAKKSNQKKATPLRWPSASRSQQSQVGQCGNSLRLYFEGSEAQTSALLCQVNNGTGLSPSSAAASEGEVQRQSQNPNPGFPRACGPRNDESRSFAMPSLRGGEADEAIQSRKWIFTSRLLSPLCAVEAGGLNWGMLRRACLSTWLRSRSCEFASRPIQASGRGSPRRGGIVGWPSLW